MSPGYDHESAFRPEGFARPGRLRLMDSRDTEAAVDLIARAMNPAESEQARQTFEFHFACRGHGLNDGRTYYILEHLTGIHGISGLHHYVWGPPENVWLAWFAVRPDGHGRGLGRWLLNAVSDRARFLGYRKLFVETYSTPVFARACTFYRSQGFEQAGHVTGYLPCGGDMVVFSKDLSQ